MKNSKFIFLSLILFLFDLNISVQKEFDPEFESIKLRVSCFPSVKAVNDETQLIFSKHESECPYSKVLNFNNGQIEVTNKYSADDGKTWNGFEPHEQKNPQLPDLPVIINYESVITSTPIRLPDGSIIGFGPMEDGRVGRYETHDNGRSWSGPFPLYPADGGPNFVGASVYDKDGRLHLFFLEFRGEREYLELYHRRSSENSKNWGPAVKIVPDVWIGALFDAICLESGRIIVPFQYAVREKTPPTGSTISTVIYSDDNGETWIQSDDKLTAPCFEGYNGNNYGACEPRVLVMNDGRIWMLIRTQAGFLYQSFSSDEGTTWSKPEPSIFYSSNSPGCPMRMDDGRIVVFWNNCENTTPLDGHPVYTTRDALHAAVSDDEGKTWSGFREVYLDAFRNDPPPERGDRGTAYPRAVGTADNKILLISGQGGGRRIQILVDPKWLCATSSESNFSGDLKSWSVFKRFWDGKKVSRAPGCDLISHPSEPGEKVLHIRLPDEKHPDVAEWNFPNGRSGSLSIRLMLKKGFQGGAIDLTDRYYQPTDIAAKIKRNFHLPIRSDGRIGDTGVYLEPEKWYELILHWDISKGNLVIDIDGKKAEMLPVLQPTHLGISYLLLRSTAEKIDKCGFLVESVKAEIKENKTIEITEPPEPIRPLINRHK